MNDYQAATVHLELCYETIKECLALYTDCPILNFTLKNVMLIISILRRYIHAT